MLLQQDQPSTPSILLLSDEERAEATRVRGKYRGQGMCSFGYQMDKWIAGALQSERERAEIRNKAEAFHNLTYIGSGEANKMPDGTFPLTGIPARQSMMEIVNCWLSGHGDTLTVDQICTTTLEIDKESCTPFPGVNFFRVNKKHGKRAITHKQIIEVTFHAPEEFYLFTRAFWHYIEAAVACHVLHAILPGTIKQELQQYAGKRGSLVERVVKVDFPRNKFPGCISDLSGPALKDWYDKYFFSRFREIMKECNELAGRIKDAIQDTGIF